MIILYIILLVVALSGLRKLNANENHNEDYLSKDTTNTIKGIFIWVVFISHIGGYMSDLQSLNMLDVYW